MAQRIKIRHLTTRAATGSYILNAGLAKFKADDETAKQLHAMAQNAYPQFGKLDAKTFTKLLATGEIVLGGALLLPIVPSRLVGIGLAAFSGGLVGIYLRSPGLREVGSVRPSPEGVGIAKDVWMLGIALSLVLDSRVTKRRSRSG